MRRTYWLVATGLVGFGALMLVGADKLAGAANAPSESEALQLSLSRIDDPALHIALAIHPVYCAVRRAGMFSGWRVNCEGIPLHFYQDALVCDPGPPQQCTSMPTTYADCRTYAWNVDGRGQPSDPKDPRRPVLSIPAERCLPKGTLASNRQAMRARGIEPIAKISMDYFGR